jgi:SAM-dependent methyltransferase
MPPLSPSLAAHTVLFDWDLSQFDRLVALSAVDDSLQLGLPFLPRDGLILEAGCGPGHKVAYLQNLGYAVEGVELNGAVVESMRTRHPALPLRVGDVGHLDVPDGHYAAVTSFGVIEHFRAGPRLPLAEHFRVLRTGGIALISVPSLNTLRRLKRVCFRLSAPFRPSLNPQLRHLLGKPPAQFNRRGADGFAYAVNPVRGPFFEYWLTPTEFASEVRAAGFTILRSEPTHHAVGLWGELGSWAARNREGAFEFTAIGRALHALFGGRSFVHNHMHTIVARK